MGAVYLVALLSLWVQFDALVGSRGILPAGDFLARIRLALPHDYFWQFPTLCWLNASDGFLHFLCAAGVVLSLAVITGLAQAPALAGLWAIYLSLTVAGQEFFEFQWDALLLEAGLLSVFFAPLQMLPRVSRQPEPSRVVLWLLRWLLFRLMFLSGLVKLLSGDDAWRDGTAMNYHYLTQPLPTWTSYWAYQLPESLQWASVWAMFGIELIAPLFIFTGRRSRQVACALFMLLQGLILATGNFGFFNLLAILLCVTLLDDAVWPRPLRRWLRVEAPSVGTPALTGPGEPVDATTRSAGTALPVPVRTAPANLGRSWPVWVTVPLAAALGMLTTMTGLLETGLVSRPPEAVLAVVVRAERFRSTNGYGLFRIMTRVRNEIVIEGSDDGKVWKEYGFQYKPGDVSRRPRFCTPHMPRLDWRIWFGVLEEAEERWFVPLLTRLLEGDETVLALFGENPFPKHPPRFIRAVEYSYTFAPRGEKGVWWRRRFLRVYYPPSALDKTPALPAPAGPP